MGTCCCKTFEPLRQDSHDAEYGTTTIHGRILPPSASTGSSDQTDRLVLDALCAVRKLAGK